jgi:hypothetical protein
VALYRLRRAGPTQGPIPELAARNPRDAAESGMNPARTLAHSEVTRVLIRPIRATEYKITILARLRPDAASPFPNQRQAPLEPSAGAQRGKNGHQISHRKGRSSSNETASGLCIAPTRALSGFAPHISLPCGQPACNRVPWPHRIARCTQPSP